MDKNNAIKKKRVILDRIRFNKGALMDGDIDILKEGEDVDFQEKIEVSANNGAIDILEIGDYFDFKELNPGSSYEEFLIIGFKKKNNGDRELALKAKSEYDKRKRETERIVDIIQSAISDKKETMELARAIIDGHSGEKHGQWKYTEAQAIGILDEYKVLSQLKEKGIIDTSFRDGVYLGPKIEGMSQDTKEGAEVTRLKN